MEQQQLSLQQVQPPICTCHDCGLNFDTPKSLDVHLLYHKENLLTKWGMASGSEDNNNEKKPQPVVDTSDYQQWIGYNTENSAFQRLQVRQSYRYQPYQLERVPPMTQQAQCDKCGFICDQNLMGDHEATVHPFFVYVKEESQAEILDLDSQKVVYQPQGEENAWLDRRYFKEENGNQSPDFGSVSTTVSSPTNSELYYEQQPVLQMGSPQLPKYPGLSKGGGGGAWKSNEARRPKTYNCSACNKWFTSSGHLKRHYNTTLHKNAVKQSGAMDPASMPMSSHHHPPTQEEKYTYQPQQQEQQPQEEFHEYFQYPNGMPPHTTNFNEPLPSFSQFQSSISGYPSVGGLLATTNLPVEMITEVPEVSSTATDQPVVHKCVDCDKTFNKACYLTQHNKSFHSGDKPFKCARCGKRFNQEHTHQEHLSKHAGEKPYKCDMCPKQFNHKTDLRRHMCLHSGDKPFACDYCGKGFIRKDHMLKHAETHKKKALASGYKKMEVDPRLHLRVM